MLGLSCLVIMALSASSSTFRSIQEYNEYLANNLISLTIKEYIIQLNNLFYKQDFSHLECFMSIVGKDEICIHHDKLKEYEVITTEDRSSVIKTMLDQYEFEEGKDFLLHNVMQQKTGRGGNNKKEYVLHPRAFKLCLMRSKNTLVYSKYYITIEEMVKYYSDYQHLYKAKLYNNSLAMKDDKIDELIKENKEQSEKIDQLLNRSDKILNKLTDVEGELQDTNEKLDIVLEDRTVFPDKKNKLQTFILLKLEEDKKYKIIYGSNAYIK